MTNRVIKDLAKPAAWPDGYGLTINPTEMHAIWFSTLRFINSLMEHLPLHMKPDTGI